METRLIEQQELPLEALREGLRKVRSRRWLLWLIIFVYIPGLVVAMGVGLPGSIMSKLFFLWVALLCVAVGMATVVKCPQCGNTFHTNGPTFLPVRKCVHCGLAVNADKHRQ